jgi:GNAT superfamily N-acetyltransferase
VPFFAFPESVRRIIYTTNQIEALNSKLRRAYEGSTIFVGEVGGVLATSCTLVVVPNLTRGSSRYGLIENVVTHSDFRRNGFGKRVLLAASNAAWEAGCYKVMLMTGSKKPKTQSFYLGAGFEQSKTGFQKRRIPVRSETQPNVSFVRE